MAIRVALALLLLLAAVPLSAQTNPAPAPSATKAHAPTTDSKVVPKQPTPTVFQADEGDRWMLLGDKPLIFKVDPLSTGSDALVVGTEEMPHQEIKFRPTSICTKMKSYSSTRVPCVSR